VSEQKDRREPRAGGRETAERRREPEARKSRLKAGSAAGAIAAPLSIISVEIYKHMTGGHEMDSQLATAVGAIMSSVITVLALCFRDIRGIILDHFARRRDGEADKE
jgi:hypothetical protein